MYFKQTATEEISDNPAALYYDLFRGQAKDANGDTITSFTRIQLRNAGIDNAKAFLRDIYAERLCAGLRVDVQASRNVMVFINGEFWGVYNAMERYDDKYFKDHYGVASENLVVLEAPSPLEDGDMYKWADYVIDEGVEGDEQAWEELLAYAQSHDLTVDEYYKVVAGQVDVDNLIDYFVVNVYFNNADWPGNNVKVWRNKNPDDESGLDTKWRVVVMDMDKSIGESYSASRNNINQLITNCVINRLIIALLYNPAVKEKFIERFRYAANEVFAPDNALPVLDEIVNDMKAAMQLHFTRWTYHSNSKWTSNVGNVRNYIQQRPQYALTYLDDFFSKFFV
jgi:spore coat protein CotH